METINSNLLVSIIVPMYNVEKYLVKCLDSITSQSHTNLEILLVNDGSPDDSGIIADNYAQKDMRVKVFHRENKGVSATRNFGLEQAIGEYVVFVDSDDYLSPDFVEYMLKIVSQTKAEFCLSKNIFTSTNMKQVTNDEIKVYSPEEATSALLYPGIVIGSWNKMFKRSLLEDKNIKFPTDFFMGEGLNFITTVSQLANKVGVGERKVYFYRTDNAESATTKFDINKLFNAFDAIKYIKKNLILKSPNVIAALEFHEWWTCFYALERIISTSSQKRYPNQYNDYSKRLKSGAFRMLLKARVSKNTKFKIFSIWISPKFITKAFVTIKKLSKK
ncbi:glycosyltransferase family 2 protein [Flavobacterium fluviatile]|uniref:glycosyltransferase family 2 protein n=1 Tax=Flavobacterium fluviatile TaxID=1862387 RepID=UPI0013D41E45|nr:glycosyltransferase family 2 protein [Flavobacterium fluviatile]